MTKQKTLLVTSIYARLWGTEFGGRSSREHHYKISLLNILNLNPDKVICFTSESELTDLENFFYTINSVSKDILEFRIFDLTSSKYFDKIHKKKNLEEMKRFDRCFEIQYDKFFWCENLTEIFDYDKIYWFDAGLSHGGLFPEKFAYGVGFERNYKFTVFNEDFLTKINEMTDEKFLLVCKNNSEMFYWSTTIPPKYYTEFKKDLHVVGGFFGGTPNDYIKIVKLFDSLLTDLLDNEPSLYMEEQILSCLLYNNPEYFTLFVFDDWYRKENHSENTRYFYHIFYDGKEEDFVSIEPVVAKEKIIVKKDISEILLNQKNFNICVTVTCIQEKSNKYKKYSESAKKLIKSYLSFTNFDILILTDTPDEFVEIENERLKVINYDEFYDESKSILGFFNYHLKRHTISIAKKLEYEIIYNLDCDCYITDWDNESFLKKCNEDFDIAFVKNAEPQLGYLRKNFEHYQNKIDTEFEGLYYDELDNSPNPDKTHMIIKNNDKLDVFLEFWDKISEKNNNKFSTYYDGIYIGSSAVNSKMKMSGINESFNFTKFSRIEHNGNILDFYGNVLN